MATLVVTTNADSGAGSLREAIASANASPGSRIEFDPAFFTGGASNTITLASGLPKISAGVTIDGTTSDGSGITINGADDRFIFNDIGETGATVASADRIHDFRLADGDRIVLTAIDADKTHGGNQAFHFIGDDAFTDAGQVRFTHVGGETRIFLNTDNDASAEAMIRVSGIHSITAGWFAL
jgi:hypothetical protein